MLVSRKKLSFIHFVASIRRVQANGAPETLHQGIVLLGLACLLGELDKPFAECVIEGTLLCPGELTGLLDEFFVSTESDIFHTRIVYTILVYTARELFPRERGAPWELRGGAQLFLNAQELVVFGDAVGARG